MAPITSLDQLDMSKAYSYADYFSWKFKERVELLKGKIYAMSPAPSRKHQRLLSKLGFGIQGFIQKSPCQLYYAPFDVRLQSNREDKKVTTVVQPDLCVICDLSKLDERGCNGAPELIVEILSPGNTAKEMKLKYELYEEAGVLEYWIVDPEHESVLKYVLEGGKFMGTRPYTTEDHLQSVLIEGFDLDLKALFSE